jgi:hypothetical protein
VINSWPLFSAKLVTFGTVRVELSTFSQCKILKSHPAQGFWWVSRNLFLTVFKFCPCALAILSVSAQKSQMSPSSQNYTYKIWIQLSVLTQMFYSAVFLSWVSAPNANFPWGNHKSQSPQLSVLIFTNELGGMFDIFQSNLYGDKLLASFVSETCHFWNSKSTVFQLSHTTKSLSRTQLTFCGMFCNFFFQVFPKFLWSRFRFLYFSDEKSELNILTKAPLFETNFHFSLLKSDITRLTFCTNCLSSISSVWYLLLRAQIIWF